MSDKIQIHCLSKGLVVTLRKFGLAVATKRRNKIHIRNDMVLDITENNNFQKLKYWGLVAKCEVEGQHIAGYWLLTTRGSLFLKNEIDMPKRVSTQDNHLRDKSAEKVRITDFYQGYREEYWQIDFSGVDLRQPVLF